jgi:2-polyprenyl-3-methyl-5-hydroxy-6-metoxy-1,4-benzoquinol methylase
MPSHDTVDVLTAYRERDVLARVQQLLAAADPVAPVRPDAIAFDQYHSGGREAVYRLFEGLDIGTESRVLDVGSGFGGPARLISEHTGAAVVGVDITSEYVAAAQWLTEQTGQDDRVSFVHSEIGELAREPAFDLALTMHVQMNIEGKSSWYRSIGEHLRPGGTLAIWEICTTANTELTWPMPWSITGTDSFLVTQDQLHDAIEHAGFVTTTWVDDSEWLKSWFTNQFASSPSANPGLGLLDNGLQRAMNFAMAFNTGALTVARGTFTRM